MTPLRVATRANPKLTTMSAADYRTLVEKGMSERDWQTQVVQFARHRGWLCYFTWRSDHSPAGHPDLTLVRSMPDGDRRIVYAELKSSKGKLTDAQREWLYALGQVAEVSNGHIEVHCWTPAQWNEVRSVLM